MSFFFFPKCLHVFLFFYTLQDRIGTLMGGRGFRRSQPHNHITRILWRKSHVLLKLNSSFFSLSGSVPMPSLSGLYTVTKKYRCGTCRGWMPAKSLQSCLTLWDPMDHSPPSSSVHGILQARITGVGCHALLQGIFPMQGSDSCLLCLPVLAGGFLTSGATWEAPCFRISNIKFMS